jgi:hypothetical protein
MVDSMKMRTLSARISTRRDSVPERRSLMTIPERGCADVRGFIANRRMRAMDERS